MLTPVVPFRSRRGLTLLEVLVSMAIFLIAIGGINQLMILSSRTALEVSQQGEAAQIAQSKLAEVMSGIVPLEPQSDTPCDEDPDFHWSLEAEPSSSAASLYQVTVTVSRHRNDGTTIQSSITRYVIDPSIRGSAADVGPVSAASSGGGGGQSQNNNNSSSNNQNMPSSGAAGGAGTPTSAPSTPAAQPATTTPTTGAPAATPSQGTSRGSTSK